MSEHLARYREDFRRQANLRNGQGQGVDRVFSEQVTQANSSAFIERLPLASKSSFGVGPSNPAPFMLGHSALGGDDSLGGL